jgi:hypothetical protein
MPVRTRTPVSFFRMNESSSKILNNEMPVRTRTPVSFFRMNESSSKITKGLFVHEHGIRFFNFLRSKNLDPFFLRNLKKNETRVRTRTGVSFFFEIP